MSIKKTMMIILKKQPYRKCFKNGWPSLWTHVLCLYINLNCLAKATITLSKNPWCYPWQPSNTRKEKKIGAVVSVSFSLRVLAKPMPFLSSSIFCQSDSLLSLPSTTTAASSRCVGSEDESSLVTLFHFLALVAFNRIFDFVKHLSKAINTLDPAKLRVL